MNTYNRRKPANLADVDWTAIDAVTDAEIKDAVAEDPDAAPIANDEDFARGQIVYPEPKTLVSLRLDTDVLESFKAAGSGYQTKMNDVLRRFAVEQGWIDRTRAKASRGPGRPRKAS